MGMVPAPKQFAPPGGVAMSSANVVDPAQQEVKIPYSPTMSLQGMSQPTQGIPAPAKTPATPRFPIRPGGFGGGGFGGGVGGGPRPRILQSAMFE